VAVSWQELKQELEAETRKIFTTCPDEIKRFHYGIITHSDAGKYSLNQYFGHWVHLYAFYYGYAGDILASLQAMAADPDFKLTQLKKLFLRFSPGAEMSDYGGQTSLAKYAAKMAEAMETITTKEEFSELVKVWHVYVGRLYWWVHWYFPWGIGPTVCRRLSPEDIEEIVRLSQPD